MRPVKIVLVGDGAVGKTCLCITYARGVFPEDYVPTIFDSYAATTTLDDTTFYLQLWDTAGQKEYDRLRPLSYPKTNIFLICFSVVSPSSYHSVSAKWIPETHHHCPNSPYILVGTKVDLREDKDTLEELKSTGSQPVSLEQGLQLAKEIGALKYVECSSLKGQGIQEVFKDAIVTVLFPPKTNKKEKTCVTL